MATAEKQIGSDFSKEALQQAVVQETIEPAKAIELNAYAKHIAEQFAEGPVSPAILTGTVCLIDFLSLTSIGMLLYFFGSGSLAGVSGFLALGIYLGAGLTVAFGMGLDGYLTQTLKNLTSSISKAFSSFALAVTVMGFFTYILQASGEFPSQWFAAWFGLGSLALAFSRTLIGGYVQQLSAEGRLDRRAVVVGGGSVAETLITAIETNPNNDIKICGIFDDRADERSPEIVAGYPRLGNIAELVEFTRKARIDMLILSLPLTAEKRMLQLLKRLWVLPVDIRLSAHTNKMQFRQRSYSYEGSVPFVDVFQKPIASWDSIAKRTFDLIIASIAIVVLSPVMLAAAIAVRLDSKGPVIFKQKREGFNNEEIEIYKFRSLYTDQGDKTGVNMVTKHDSRVTPVGRFIRKTSIDELPQLFNVLQGRLSLVGPRPHVANAQTDNRLWAEVVDSYIARHKVKPGVTGWAQITGWRGEVDCEEKLKGRVDADLYYIENWSLMFDLYILAMTPLRLFNTENAY